jgi:hypothetical protein
MRGRKVGREGIRRLEEGHKRQLRTPSPTSEHSDQEKYGTQGLRDRDRGQYEGKMRKEGSTHLLAGNPPLRRSESGGGNAERGALGDNEVAIRRCHGLDDAASARAPDRFIHP